MPKASQPRESEGIITRRVRPGSWTPVWVAGFGLCLMPRSHLLPILVLSPKAGNVGALCSVCQPSLQPPAPATTFLCPRPFSDIWMPLCPCCHRPECWKIRPPESSHQPVTDRSWCLAAHNPPFVQGTRRHAVHTGPSPAGWSSGRPQWKLTESAPSPGCSFPFPIPPPPPKRTTCTGNLVSAFASGGCELRLQWLSTCCVPGAAARKGHRCAGSALGWVYVGGLAMDKESNHILLDGLKHNDENATG